MRCGELRRWSPVCFAGLPGVRSSDRVGPSPCRWFRSVLPRGRRDFVRQLSIWTGFAAAYTAVRWLPQGGLRRRCGTAALDPTREAPRRAPRTLPAAPATRSRRRARPRRELDLLGRAVPDRPGRAALDIHEAEQGYLRVRDTLIVANTIGLVGYLCFRPRRPGSFPAAVSSIRSPTPRS